MIQSLNLDLDQLATNIPLVIFERSGRYHPYVSWQTVKEYAEQHGSNVHDALAGYKGNHTTDRSGYSYLRDWLEFLDGLREARAIAADPSWEIPKNGVVQSFF